ncbi:MAG: hypothetical protein M0Q87_15130, partial [Ottowia sp.]|nr:hypothetical protein [Ottowia sp.]
RICPIKTQSAGMAGAMASICNAEWADSDGQSGHDGFVLKLSAAGIAVALAAQGLQAPRFMRSHIMRRPIREFGFHATAVAATQEPVGLWSNLLRQWDKRSIFVCFFVA